MKTILVIDDEIAIAELLTSVLEFEGYRVLTAYNGLEGWQRLEQELSDLVLSDVMMPLLDGLKLCQNIQAHPRLRIIPVILMSAAGTSVARSACDYSAFLRKPFNIDDLLTAVGQALGPAG